MGDPSWYQANNDPVISNSIHRKSFYVLFPFCDPFFCLSYDNMVVLSKNVLYSVEGLRPGSTYEFRVFSLKNGQLSAPSEVNCSSSSFYLPSFPLSIPLFSSGIRSNLTSSSMEVLFNLSISSISTVSS